MEGHTIADTRMADVRYLEGARRTALRHGLVSPATVCLSRLATLCQSRLTRTVALNSHCGIGSPAPAPSECLMECRRCRTPSST